MADTQAPVTVSIIGTGNSEGGGVAPTPNGTLATTPGTQPNILFNVVTPTIAVLVRFVNVYLTTFVGLLTLAGVGGDQAFAATDLIGILKSCAWASLLVSAVATVKNVITILGRVEGRYPLATGSI